MSEKITCRVSADNINYYAFYRIFTAIHYFVLLPIIITIIAFMDRVWNYDAVCNSRGVPNYSGQWWAGGGGRPARRWLCGNFDFACDERFNWKHAPLRVYNSDVWNYRHFIPIRALPTPSLAPSIARCGTDVVGENAFINHPPGPRSEQTRQHSTNRQSSPPMIMIFKLIHSITVYTGRTYCIGYYYTSSSSTA